MSGSTSTATTSTWARARSPPAETHCGGVRVSFRVYDPLQPGTDRPGKVRALKCLLQERGGYAGSVDGTYGAKLVAAVRAWQAAHGLPESDSWSRKAWMSLLADGARPVVKIGSAGSQVRRLQRALNASDHGALAVTGVFDPATRATVRVWQAKAGVEVTGVVSSRQWRALQAGRR